MFGVTIQLEQIALPAVQFHPYRRTAHITRQYWLTI